MSLFDHLRNLLHSQSLKAPPSTLRNKAGGLARVRIVDDHTTGAADMNGCFVTTVRLDGDGFWIVHPPLEFTCRTFMLASSGRIALPGDPAVVESMHDDLLEPIRDVGDWEMDESVAWLPPAPVSERGRVSA